MTAREVWERTIVKDDRGKRVESRGQEIIDATSAVLGERFDARRAAFREVALFEQEDLEQEVWARLIEAQFDGDIEDYTSRAYQIAEHLARKGRRRGKIGRTVTFSELGRNDREIEDYINKHAVRVFR